MVINKLDNFSSKFSYNRNFLFPFFFFIGSSRKTFLENFFILGIDWLSTLQKIILTMFFFSENLKEIEKFYSIFINVRMSKKTSWDCFDKINTFSWKSIKGFTTPALLFFFLYKNTRNSFIEKTFCQTFPQNSLITIFFVLSIKTSTLSCNSP